MKLLSEVIKDHLEKFFFSSLLLTILHVRSFPQIFRNPWLRNWNLKSLLETLECMNMACEISLCSNLCDPFGHTSVIRLKTLLFDWSDCSWKTSILYLEDTSLAAQFLGVK